MFQAARKKLSNMNYTNDLENPTETFPDVAHPWSREVLLSVNNSVSVLARDKNVK